MSDLTDQQSRTVNDIFQLSRETDICRSAEMNISRAWRALLDATHDYQIMTPKNLEIRIKLEKEIQNIEGIFDESNDISVDAGHRFEKALESLASRPATDQLDFSKDVTDHESLWWDKATGLYVRDEDSKDIHQLTHKDLSPHHHCWVGSLPDSARRIV